VRKVAPRRPHLSDLLTLSRLPGVPDVFNRVRVPDDLDDTSTGDTTEGIVFGVGSTARLITGAALIIIAVFAGFAAGELVAFQQMGFGVAVALLIDATIVRLVVIPAAMSLLGERNWYLPARLEWLPHVEIEGPALSAGGSKPRESWFGTGLA
jgi:uncharacterized membrane protein YdfJ with MMPL/SSD domain